MPRGQGDLRERVHILGRERSRKRRQPIDREEAAWVVLNGKQRRRVPSRRSAGRQARCLIARRPHPCRRVRDGRNAVVSHKAIVDRTLGARHRAQRLAGHPPDVVRHHERMSEPGAEAWPELAGLIRSSPVHREVRPLRSDSRTADNLSLTNRSYLGALALNTSGFLFDSGWLRLLGGSSGDQLPGLDEANADARACSSSGSTSWAACSLWTGVRWEQGTELSTISRWTLSGGRTCGRHTPPSCQRCSGEQPPISTVR